MILFFIDNVFDDFMLRRPDYLFDGRIKIDGPFFETDGELDGLVEAVYIR
jgi:hypothetical protein